mmetsp:Transcript_31821/g.92441  ORF Transcript_31821/g.92441 Transcript_31821/m.92441 type:complete len:124 (+) Transcript_31821:251-622(+)
MTPRVLLTNILNEFVSRGGYSYLFILRHHGNSSSGPCPGSHVPFVPDSPGFLGDCPGVFVVSLFPGWGTVAMVMKSTEEWNIFLYPVLATNDELPQPPKEGTILDGGVSLSNQLFEAMEGATS